MHVLLLISVMLVGFQRLVLYSMLITSSLRDACICAKLQVRLLTLVQQLVRRLMLLLVGCRRGRRRCVVLLDWLVVCAWRGWGRWLRFHCYLAFLRLICSRRKARIQINASK